MYDVPVIHESHNFKGNRAECSAVMTISLRFPACYSLMAEVLYHGRSGTVNDFWRGTCVTGEEQI